MHFHTTKERGQFDTAIHSLLRRRTRGVRKASMQNPVSHLISRSCTEKGWNTRHGAGGRPDIQNIPEFFRGLVLHE